MVATLASLSSAAQASTYYEADDYYAEGGLAPSAWLGSGATALGLSGEVDRRAFQALLEGRLSDGQILGTHRDGQLAHRPGWDLTFSAPKSVSVMALVAGDRRLIEGHDQSVRAALTYVERYAATARIRRGSQIEIVRTASLVAASFRHETSRSHDPQLHTHAVILNVTQDPDGQWRSLASRELYLLQKAAGEIYRQELAAIAHRLGYTIDPGIESTFEVGGVPAAVLQAFSGRSAQIEARLAERGESRKTASAVEKQIAALDTRVRKEDSDRGQLVRSWREEADRLAFDMEARRQAVCDASQSADNDDRQLVLHGQGEATAANAVQFASAKLGERQAVFSSADLEREAGRFALGRSNREEIAKAVAKSLSRSELQPRIFRDPRGLEGEGFTTSANIALEKRLLQAELQGRGAAEPLARPIEAARVVSEAMIRSQDQGHTWTDDQRAATRALLTSANRVVGVQGYAGTAKTTTVLATFARAAQAAGYRVTALAPSASAARTIGEALNLEGQTVARHLKATQLAASPKTRRGEIWLVDEASLLSARDMARLLDAAARVDARTVLVGDVKQLGSVEAGAAFRQLQDANMETVRLAQIVRQTNASLLDAVEATIEGDVRRAFDALDRGGGRIVEAATPDERHDLIASRYAQLSPEERRGTLIIDPSRESRDSLTNKVRAELLKAGALGDESTRVRTLVSKGLTRAEARDVRSYQVGDIITFGRAYGEKGLAKRAAGRVEAIDPNNSSIELSFDGRRVEWAPRQWGAQVEAFVPADRELRVGDRVEFTRNDYRLGRVNGMRGEITSVGADRGQAIVKAEDGKTHRLHLAEAQDQHIRHSYVQTMYPAQGRTVDRVLIHADSARTNLVDLSSLYVGLSRARSEALVFTDKRSKLLGALSERAGGSQSALSVAGTREVREASNAAPKRAKAGLSSPSA